MKKKITISNFDLAYYGIYIIKWGEYSESVYLELNTILKMLDIEGYSLEEIEHIIGNNDPLHFDKVNLQVWVEEEGGKITGFYTSDATENYYFMNTDLTLIDVELESSPIKKKV